MRARPACRSAAIPVALSAMLMLLANGAHAAATLIASTPTRYAALIHSPPMIRLQFSERLVKSSTRVRLTDVAGREERVGPVRLRGDSTLEVRIDKKLDAGVYMVHWTTVSAVDGSKTAGSYQFTVQ